MTELDSEPRVSVIIPVYATPADFFREAIASVLAQTYPRWELIIVLDGAVEACARTAHLAESEHGSRIRVVGRAGGEPSGLSSARNLGITHARGRYIALLDADDVLLPRKFEEQVDLLEENADVAMVFGNSIYWHSWTGRDADADLDYVPLLGITGGTVVSPPTLVSRFLDGRVAVPVPCSVLVRRSAIDAVGGFNERFKDLYEDQVFYVRISLRFPVLVCDATWDRYRQHPDSMTAHAARAGSHVAARQRFLTWVQQEANAAGALDLELERCLENELWKLRHPVLARLVRTAKRLLQQVFPGVEVRSPRGRAVRIPPDD